MRGTRRIWPPLRSAAATAVLPSWVSTLMVTTMWGKTTPLWRGRTGRVSWPVFLVSEFMLPRKLPGSRCYSALERMRLRFIGTWYLVLGTAWSALLQVPIMPVEDRLEPLDAMLGLAT